MLADFDNDGNLDLFVSNGDIGDPQKNAVYFGDGCKKSYIKNCTFETTNRNINKTIY